MFQIFCCTNACINMNKICSVNAQSTFKDNPNNMSTEASEGLDENVSIDAEFIQMKVKNWPFQCFVLVFFGI